MPRAMGNRRPLWEKYARTAFLCPFCQQPVPREKLTCPSCGTSVCSFEAGPSSWQEVNAAKKVAEGR